MANDWNGIVQEMQAHMLNASLTHVRNEGLTRELAEKEATIAELQRQMTELEQRNNQFQREKEELTNGLAEKTRSEERLQRQISDLEQRHNDLADEASMNVADEQKWRRHRDQLEHQNRKLQERSSKLLLRNGGLTDQLYELGSENAHLKQEVQIGYRSNERLQNAHTEVTNAALALQNFVADVCEKYQNYAAQLLELGHTATSTAPFTDIAKMMLNDIGVKYSEHEHLWRRVNHANINTVMERAVASQETRIGSRQPHEEVTD